MEDSIRQLFTAEARTTARMSRAESTSERGSFVDGFGIFIVASGGQLSEYAWEVRRRDGSVLERSTETFRTMLLARYAGVRALAGD